VLLLGLTTGHKIGLLVMGLVFIAFSLFSAFVAPRRWTNYPGRFFSVFIVGCFVLFALMIAAVEVFGAESGEESAKASEAAPAGQKQTTFAVSESEWKVVLPKRSAKELKQGTYTLHVTNDGKVVHNLYVNGPGVKNQGTHDLKPGESANLTVKLETGTYDVYCAIPGHKQLGMDAKLPVG
jgi:uncharacterized cupredoxin-like copper-binding protein